MLNIIYEDEDLLVVNKPINKIMYGENSSLLNDLINYCSHIEKVERTGLIHRLDKCTSGLLMVAKNNKTHEFISNQFRNRTIIKIYDLIVYGKMVPYLKIETCLLRKGKKILVSNKGKIAITECFLQKTNNIVSHIKCRIHTGRTHQIRVHMQHINHEIVGENIYTNRRYIQYKRTCLHASEIEFEHINGKKIKLLSNPEFIDDFFL